MSDQRRLHVAAAVLLLVVPISSSRAENGIFHVCAGDLTSGAVDAGDFGRGPIIVPAGAVFDYAGVQGEGSADPRHTSAVVTTAATKLTRQHPCGTATTRVAIAAQWGWTVPTIFADPRIKYQAYGVVRNGRFQTDFDNDFDPFASAAARGELNGTVEDTITEHVDFSSAQDQQ